MHGILEAVGPTDHHDVRFGGYADIGERTASASRYIDLHEQGFGLPG